MTHIHLRRGAGELLIVALNAGEIADVVDVEVPNVEGMVLWEVPLPGWDAGYNAGPIVVRDGHLTLAVDGRRGRVLRGAT
jgi:hypothetical protein